MVRGGRRLAPAAGLLTADRPPVWLAADDPHGRPTRGRGSGLHYEWEWVDAWVKDRAGTPMWPVWVALHRLPEYDLLAQQTGPGPFVRRWTPFIKRQAKKRRLLYVLLDALPEPWARRLYMTPGAEWLDDPGRLVEALR